MNSFPSTEVIMKTNAVRRRAALLARLALLLPALLRATPAAASTSGGAMPWDGPLNALADNIQGPLPMAFIIGAIVLGALLLAFGDFSAGGKRIVMAIIGGSIALGVISFMSAVGLSGALLP
jgi:type IV secretion system protein VirB2